jgi:hypothetical protein
MALFTTPVSTTRTEIASKAEGRYDDNIKVGVRMVETGMWTGGISRLRGSLSLTSPCKGRWTGGNCNRQFRQKAQNLSIYIVEDDCREKGTIQTRTLGGQKAEFWNVKAAGRYSIHCALNE